MAVRRDEEVARVVGVGVEHDEVERAAEEDVVLPVIAGLRLDAQDASLGFFLLDVLEAPRRPEVVHFEPPARKVRRGTASLL